MSDRLLSTTPKLVGIMQTLAPVLEAAIDLLSIQGLLPEKVTVK